MTMGLLENSELLSRSSKSKILSETKIGQKISFPKRLLEEGVARGGPEASMPKVLCKPHYGHSHLEMVV